MKKNKIVSIALSCILVIAIASVSCNKSISDSDTPVADTKPFIPQVKSVEKGINSSLKAKIQTTFGSVKKPKKQHVGVNSVRTNEYGPGVNQELINFDNPTYVSYTNTTVNAVLFDQGNGTYFVCFTQYGLVADMAAIFTTQTVNSNLAYGAFYDLDNQLVARFGYDNQSFFDVSTYDPTPINQTNGWWSRWKSCMSYNFNVLSSPDGIVMGVTCALLAPPCMAGMATACAANATFN